MAFNYSDFDLFEIKHFTLGNYGMYQEKGIKNGKAKVVIIQDMSGK